MEVIRSFAGRVPLLGVCLGHQAIGQVFGAKVVPARRIVHGKTSLIQCDQQGLFQSLESTFTAMRYHSLALEKASLPPALQVSATSEEGEIMGIRLVPSSCAPVEGIQFHPESIMTPLGKQMLRNFVKMGQPRYSKEKNAS